MTNESLPNRDLQNLWQSQKSEGIRMSVDEIRQRAGRFGEKIYWRNAREYVAALMVVAYFAFKLWRGPDMLAGVGYALLIAGMLYLVWQLHRRGSSRTPPQEMGLESGVDFFRRELERQRDMLQHVWNWYLGPLVPGLIVVMVAIGRTNPHHLRHYGWIAAASDLLSALVFIFIWRLNQRAAKSLQQRIEELDALKGER